MKVGYETACVLRNSQEHEVTVVGVSGTNMLNINTETFQPTTFVTISIPKREREEQEDYVELSISDEKRKVR